MNLMEKLGQQLLVAFAENVPAELIALVVTTSNHKRLQDLFNHASVRLLDAHQRVGAHPNSAPAKAYRLHCKALLDLVRVRMSVIGCRRPTIDRAISLMGKGVPINIVNIRKAA